MQTGFYKGKHYTEWVDEVKQLRRSGSEAEAVVLLEALVDAVTEECRVEKFPPPSWYHHQLAIISAKRKDLEAERDYIEEYCELAGRRADPEMKDRLRKVQAKIVAAANVRAGCPYCGVDITPMPQRTRKCPHCAARVVVRKKDGVPVLMTESAIESFEDSKSVDSEVLRFLKLGNTYRLTDTQIRKAARRHEGNYVAGLIELLDEKANEAPDDFMDAWYRRALASLRSENGDRWLADASLALQAEQRCNAKSFDGKAGFGGCACAPCVSQSWSGAASQYKLHALLTPHVDCAKPPCTCSLYVDRTLLEEAEPIHSVSTKVISVAQPQEESEKRSWWRRLIIG